MAYYRLSGKARLEGIAILDSLPQSQAIREYQQQRLQRAVGHVNQIRAEMDYMRRYSDSSYYISLTYKLRDALNDRNAIEAEITNADQPTEGNEN
jgi:hypothetical protein